MSPELQRLVDEIEAARAYGRLHVDDYTEQAEPATVAREIAVEATRRHSRDYAVRAQRAAWERQCERYAAANHGLIHHYEHTGGQS